MAGIGSKTDDLEDIVFRRDDNSFSDMSGKTHKVINETANAKGATNE